MTQLHTLGIESVADLATYFSQSTYEQGVVDEIVEPAKVEKPKVAAARVRLAWEAARAQTTKKAELASSGSRPAEDLDAPLDIEDFKAQVQEFRDAYHLTYDEESMPCSTQFARAVREFKRRNKSLDNIFKVKSQAQFAYSSSGEKSASLGAGIQVVFSEDLTSTDRDLSSIPRLLWAFKLMANTWAVAGAMMVDSKFAPNTRVREAELTHVTAYVDFLHIQAIAHPGPPKLTVDWLIDRDRQTRSKARQLCLSGWPFG